MRGGIFAARLALGITGALSSQNRLLFSRQGQRDFSGGIALHRLEPRGTQRPR